MVAVVPFLFTTIDFGVDPPVDFNNGDPKDWLDSTPSAVALLTGLSSRLVDDVDIDEDRVDDGVAILSDQ